MRILLCVVLFVFAQTGEGKDYDEYEAMARYRNKPEFHQMYQEPVPFGHIGRKGFGDPFSVMKPPIDGFELGMKDPKNSAEALELLKTARPSDIIFVDPQIRKQFAKPNPKEEMLIERYVNPQPEANVTILKWYDLAAIQGRNAMGPSRQQFIAKKKAPVRRPAEHRSVPGEKSAYFSKHSFMLEKTDHVVPKNWTTCDEFAVGAIFAPKDVINVKWTPFYVWDDRGGTAAAQALEHTFEYPTAKLVSDYYMKYNKLVNKTIDWSRAKLLMKGNAEILLIAADKRGLFHAIVKHELPDSASTYNIQLPSLTLRIKIEDPYVVMTFCEEHYATVMAVSGNEPTDAAEMIAEAATIKFIGTGRPVWRNIEAERNKIKLEKEAKIREENERIIIINDPVPPIGERD